MSGQDKTIDNPARRAVECAGKKHISWRLEDANVKHGFFQQRLPDAVLGSILSVQALGASPLRAYMVIKGIVLRTECNFEAVALIVV